MKENHLKWLLVVSIILNTFLIGLMVGRGLFSFTPPPPPPPPQHMKMESLASKLSPQAAEIVRNSFSKHKKDHRKHMKEMRRAGKEWIATLEAEPFNLAAFEQKHQALRKLMEAQGDEMEKNMRALVETCNAQDRKHLARFLKENAPFGKRFNRPSHRGGKKGRMPMPLQEGDEMRPPRCPTDHMPPPPHGEIPPPPSNKKNPSES